MFDFQEEQPTVKEDHLWTPAEWYQQKASKMVCSGVETPVNDYCCFCSKNLLIHVVISNSAAAGCFFDVPAGITA